MEKLAKRPIKVAGKNTLEDWKAIAAKLTPQCEKYLWERAYDEFFYHRLKCKGATETS